jgi:hypothetical protein
MHGPQIVKFVRISFEKPWRWDIQATAVFVDFVPLLTLRTEHYEPKT